MRGATAHLPDIGRAGVGRLVVTWLALLAFAMQSYITQTHIHLDPAAAGRAPIVAVGGAITAHSPAPTEHEEIACPFCQAIAAAGGFVTPAHVALSFLVSQAETAALPPIAVGLAAIAAGFSWRSRAPPQS
jgi:hypothetical protein